MNNAEKFKRIYDELHAPEDLLGKVMDLKMEKSEFKTRNVIKAAVCALAVTIGTFVAGNGICYAATGESLVTKIKVVINGEETEKDVQWTQNGDAFHGEIVIPSEDGASVTVLTVSDDIPENMNVSMEYQEGESVGEGDAVTEDTVILEVSEDESVNSVTVEKKDVVSGNSSVNVDEEK
nr:hypothetical protein [Lachnospiraceae bacterium]